MVDGPHRQKVSLVWHPDDVTAVLSSQMRPDENGKYMEMPTPHYSSYPYDSVFDAKGQQVGFSSYAAFLAPDSAWVSLAIVDEASAKQGTELTILWGEPDGGSNRPTVERHVQKEIRATVSGWPFSAQAQSGYRPT